MVIVFYCVYQKGIEIVIDKNIQGFNCKSWDNKISLKGRKQVELHQRQYMFFVYTVLQWNY